MGVEAHTRRDDGVATVWGLTWIFVTAMVGWLGVVAAAIMSAQHHLDGAADLSSLSGAARLQRGGDGCAVAAVIAQANEAALSRCRLEGSDVIVTLTGSIALPFGLDGSLTSAARAGP